MLRTLPALTAVIMASLTLQACSFHMPKFGIPRVHKPLIQQGNIVTQEMIDQLKPGMTRSQVVFVMGRPVVQNTFNKNRWDYVYTLRLPTGNVIEQTVSLFFSDERLAYFTGDLAPSSATENTENTEDTATEDMKGPGSIKPKDDTAHQISPHPEPQAT